MLRDLGETDEALAHIREALRLARRVDVEREADVRATLGSTLVHAGRTREGLAQLDLAADGLGGVPLARVLVRRARVRAYYFAQLEEGAADLQRALELLDGSGDDVWLARALNLVGWTSIGLGDLDAARRAFDRSIEIDEAMGQPGAVAVGVHNLGWLAYLQGDLPRAFELYADAEARFDAWGGPAPSSSTTGARPTSPEAWPSTPSTSSSVRSWRVRCSRSSGPTSCWRWRGPPTRPTTPSAGHRRPTRPAGLFRRQGRLHPWISAELLAISARAGSTDRPGRLLDRVQVLVDVAREARAPELPQALLMGAELAGRVRSSRAEEARDRWLDEASGFRGDPTVTIRALGWLALARRRATGGSGAVLRACERGLAALDEHRATLGSQELHARSSAHGAELAELGTRTALASGEPRRLLRWSERWRATALSVPSTSAGHDPATDADLAALRAQHRRLADARASGEPTEHLQARATRLEQSVRQRLLHARGTGETASALDVRALLDALAHDDTTLVELVEIDGRLHAITVDKGRVRRLEVGPAAEAAKAVDFALFTLRQAARGRRAQLDVAGARLQRSLLGGALEGVGESRVVVSGTSALQGVPWGLLPALADRPFTSTPSARLWLRSRAASAESDRRVLLVGPGLGSGGAEVPAVAAQDAGAEVLDGDRATVSASLAALDGAALAHVAAHGHFREDSPLFSSLTLADGPLLVHDLQHLASPPHRVVLSACESGVMAPVGDQELLGLAAALLSMGTAGVVSSLAEVDDAATVEVMVALHAALRAGGGLGDALLAARQVAAGDPVLVATAASFTVLGT